MITDSRALPLSGASQDQAAAYDMAIAQLAEFRPEVVETAAALKAAAPRMAMAHVLDASLALVSTEAGMLPQLRSALDAALALEAGATERERMHMAALGRWLARDHRGAARLYSRITDAYPTDLLAHVIGHQADFLTGRQRALMDRPAQALAAWDPGIPGRHWLHGMHAFGLEENGSYRAAEAAARRALEGSPTDVWAIHAIAHCCEMEDRRIEGIAFMEGCEADWATPNGLVVHNWWHRALFHLGIGDEASVLAIYDLRVAPGPDAMALDLVDASAMLWRLMLKGVDVADRAACVAEGWDRVFAPAGAIGHYPFNDVHAAFARVAAGRFGDVEWQVAGLKARAREGDREAGAIESIALPLVEAILAFGRGRHGEAAWLLEEVAADAIRLGGSHAQRDVHRQTLEVARTRRGLLAAA
ncbi:MAG: tetratricopeptide repeat protein [Sphingomonadaceae bacterium]